MKTSKSDHSNIKYLQQENNGLKAKIIELENSVAQRDSTIDRYVHMYILLYLSQVNLYYYYYYMYVCMYVRMQLVLSSLVLM